MRKIKEFIKLSRPGNVAIAFLSVIIAAIVASRSIYPISNVLLAAISASFITIGANVINDYFDIAIDKINKPLRPLATGKIKPPEALYFFIFSYLAGWIIAYSINPAMFIVALIIGILLFFYSFKFKKMVLIGNLVVSFSTAVAFIFGGMAVDNIHNSWFPAGFAFLFHFGREIIKDIQDTRGDEKYGATTFAVKFGFKVSWNLTFAIFILLIILTIIPYIFDIYGDKYLFTVILGIYPVLFYVLYSSFKNREPDNLGKLSNLLKADMLIGLLAIYFG